MTIANELKSVKQAVDESKQQMIKQFQHIPQTLTDTMLNKFTIQGAIPVTLDNMKHYFDTRFQMIENKLSTSVTDNSHVNDVMNSNDDDPNHNQRFTNWTWGGCFHMVPEDWCLPKSNIKDIWNLWWFGHQTDRIQPYRHLKSDDFKLDTQKSQLTRIRKVMMKLEEIGREKKFIEADQHIHKFNKQKCNELFDQCFNEMLKQLYPNDPQRRIGEVTIPTIYDHINRLKPNRRKRKKNQNNDNNEEAE